MRERRGLRDHPRAVIMIANFSIRMNQERLHLRDGIAERCPRCIIATSVASYRIASSRYALTSCNQIVNNTTSDEIRYPMNLSDREREAVARVQDASHGEGYDYVAGSPHLKHDTLRERVHGKIHWAVAEVLKRQPSCTVLEVGAGHGSFTETVIGAGGTPTVTEMSKASYDILKRKFSSNSGVQVVYDPDGSAPLRLGMQFDVILMISVIHHIPDYIKALTDLCDEVLRPGGILVTFQDPLWYPRETRRARFLSTGSYFAWRVTQGNLRRGLSTRWRRLRGIFNDSPEDLVEYHVVRQGVDECALTELLRARFADVEVDRYFSTQAPLLQAIGAKYFPSNTFGIVASGRKDLIPPVGPV
jgi:2-polyprenyl-3-methyl-5-hydroxy-6-metoxy-1,4-benzoquinol methylase